MPTAVVIFAAVVAAAGGYYLFASRSAARLAGVEPTPANARRRRLRRVSGAILVALAGLLVAGFAVNADRHPAVYLSVWAAIVVLLGVVIQLASIDLRLTARLRRDFKP